MPKQKRTKRIPKGYDSRLEYDLAKNELKKLQYHPERINYVIPSTYEPDFKYQVCLEKDCSCTQRRRCGRSKEILVEVKGRFRTRAEARKYIYVRESFPQEKESGSGKEKELIFVFQDSDKPMPGARKRKKCGTKQTMGEWAELNGFRFVCIKEGIPKWLQQCKLPPKATSQ